MMKRFQIGGMSCINCAQDLEKTLQKNPQIQRVQVNFASETAEIVSDLSPSELITIIGQTGYSAELQRAALPEKSLSWRIIILLFIALFFLIEMMAMFFHQHLFPSFWVFLSASVAQILAYPFYRQASFRSPNMATLVVTGTTAVYLYSVYLYFSGSEALYFEASSMVIAFVSIGKWLEERTKRHSLNALSELLKLTPPTVEKITNGESLTISASKIKMGDVLKIQTGERLCADGVLLSGGLVCDEAHLTGEALPLNKMVGDVVRAGALVLNGGGHYEVTASGEKTLLGDLTEALQRAQNSTAPITRLTDKVARIFIPAVLGLSFLTFCFSLFYLDTESAFFRAVSVLVVACPCALGLATPASLMAGLGQAIRHGIWFKNAEALEKLAEISVFVVDKTGTLTVGKPTIQAVYSLIDDLDDLSASLAQFSTHPLAKALTGNPHFSVANHREMVGQGLIGTINGTEYRLGQWFKEQLPESWAEYSVVTLSTAEKLLGAYAFGDVLRTETPSTVEALQRLGKKVIILSGDRSSAVEKMANQLNIQDFYSECTPSEKLAIIQNQQKLGLKVAMVGDGLNDAPALAGADLGLSVYGGTTIAQLSADIRLMRPNLSALLSAYLIARATKNNIQQNLFFALIYNLLMLPLAMLGYLNPMWAGLAMAFSSLSVLFNALRLKNKRF